MFSKRERALHVEPSSPTNFDRRDTSLYIVSFAESDVAVVSILLFVVLLVSIRQWASSTCHMFTTNRSSYLSTIYFSKWITTGTRPLFERLSSFLARRRRCLVYISGDLYLLDQLIDSNRNRKHAESRRENDFFRRHSLHRGYFGYAK